MTADVHALLGSIGTSVVSASALAARLGVSRPTLSRLVAAAGPQVVRMGRTRATRYALAREVPSVGASVVVRRIGVDGRPERLGSLRALAGGRHLLLREDGSEHLYEGIPPFVEDMRPQGFLGRRFSERHPELELPPRLQDWSADHCLVALALRGEDAVGDLILGDPSFDRWIASAPIAVARADYPAVAREVALHGAGSSAGGEHPKFTAFTGERHVLVKYAAAAEAGPAAARWRELLCCEAIALSTLREVGVSACHAELFDEGGLRFLEVDRFDRVGPRGRKGVISLGAWDNEHLGTHRSWTSAAGELTRLGHIDEGCARQIRWLDVFGELIANSDRHFWNLAFFWDSAALSGLTPAYDMLPMLFAPAADGSLPVREFRPSPPSALTLDVWPEAAEAALLFWRRVGECAEISADFRRVAQVAGERLEAVRAAHSHLFPR